MDETKSVNLDIVFKRYLKIMRPYLLQLTDQNVINVCNAWIRRLSSCDANEKQTRNNYVFSLCYQLAKGLLYEPFLNYPTETELQPLYDDMASENSSTDTESDIKDSIETNTKTIYSNKKTDNSDRENLDNDIDFSSKQDKYYEMPKYNAFKNQSFHKHTNKVGFCTPRNISEGPENCYTFRANNLIMRLREIKIQNMLLQSELKQLKEQSKVQSENHNEVEDGASKVNNTTSASLHDLESITNLKSLHLKLQEVQDAKKGLLSKLNTLQDKLEHYNEIKNKELEDMEENYKLEVIKVKSLIREEVKQIYEKKNEDLKEFYENTIKELEQNLTREKHRLEIEKEEDTKDKIKLINTKDKEIDQLKNQIREQNFQFHSLLNKFLDKSEDDVNSESIRLKAQQIESRLNKIEKSKHRCAKAYESKLANLQREKQLAECSLQLQLAKQRAQVINEITDENQSELITALNKLEAKYKDIVANVQATAIQRRLQDQMMLESALQVACGTHNALYTTSLSPDMNQLFKVIRNQNNVVSKSLDSEIPPIVHDNKVNNRSLGEESILVGYCLDSEKLGTLFEKVNIPQKDVGDGPSKK